MNDAPEGTAGEQRPVADDADDAAAEREVARDARGRLTAGNPFRFVPGQSGNPAGRPKGISAIIDRVIAEEVDTKSDLGQREALELMVRAMVRTALKGGTAGTSAFRELMDRRFGRVPLALKLGPDESEGPSEIRIRVVGRDDVPAVRAPAKLAPPPPASYQPGNGNGNGNGNRDPSA